MAEVRLIDGNKLEAVLRNISDHLDENGEIDFAASVYVIVDIVKKQPTIDAVEVVRCKDCAKDGLSTCAMCYVERKSLFFVCHDPEFYCGYGERKGGSE